MTPPLGATPLLDAAAGIEEAVQLLMARLDAATELANALPPTEVGDFEDWEHDRAAIEVIGTLTTTAVVVDDWVGKALRRTRCWAHFRREQDQGVLA
jgi:hypothetical protein